MAKGKSRAVDMTNPSTWPTFKVVVSRYRKILEYTDVFVTAPDEDIAARLAVADACERQKRHKVRWYGPKCVDSDINYYKTVEKQGEDNGNQ